MRAAPRRAWLAAALWLAALWLAALWPGAAAASEAASRAGVRAGEWAGAAPAPALRGPCPRGWRARGGACVAEADAEGRCPAGGVAAERRNGAAAAAPAPGAPRLVCRLTRDPSAPASTWRRALGGSDATQSLAGVVAFGIAALLLCKFCGGGGEGGEGKAESGAEAAARVRSFVSDGPSAPNERSSERSGAGWGTLSAAPAASPAAKADARPQAIAKARPQAIAKARPAPGPPSAETKKRIKDKGKMFDKPSGKGSKRSAPDSPGSPRSKSKRWATVKTPGEVVPKEEKREEAKSVPADPNVEPGKKWATVKTPFEVARPEAASAPGQRAKSVVVGGGGGGGGGGGRRRSAGKSAGEGPLSLAAFIAKAGLPEEGGVEPLSGDSKPSSDGAKAASASPQSRAKSSSSSALAAFVASAERETEEADSRSRQNTLEKARNRKESQGATLSEFIARVEEKGAEEDTPAVLKSSKTLEAQKEAKVKAKSLATGARSLLKSRRGVEVEAAAEEAATEEAALDPDRPLRPSHKPRTDGESNREPRDAKEEELARAAQQALAAEAAKSSKVPARKGKDNDHRHDSEGEEEKEDISH